MEAIARLGLFFGTYFTILILTSISNIENTIKYFQEGIFIFTSLILGGWIYYLHFTKKSPPVFLREILYVMLFLCLITVLWSFNLDLSVID
jgi:hypothetical protein